MVSRYLCAYCIHYSWQFNVGSVPLKRFFKLWISKFSILVTVALLSQISMHSLDLFVKNSWILLKHIMFLFHRKYALIHQQKPSGITLWAALECTVACSWSSRLVRGFPHKYMASSYCVAWACASLFLRTFERPKIHTAFYLYLVLIRYRYSCSRLVDHLLVLFGFYIVVWNSCFLLFYLVGCRCITIISLNAIRDFCSYYC